MADENIVKLYHRNSLPSADALLTQEVGEFADVMLVGYDHDGRLRYCATKGLKVADLFFLVDNFKHDIITNGITDKVK